MYRVFYGSADKYHRDFKKVEEAREFNFKVKGCMIHVGKKPYSERLFKIRTKISKFINTNTNRKRKREKYAYYILYGDGFKKISEHGSFKEAKKAAKGMDKYIITGSYKEGWIKETVYEKGYK